MDLVTLVGSIPSPSIEEFQVGPLTIHIYGIFMGIAVATAYIVTVRRYERLGGDPTVAEKAGMWAVVIGFLVARLAYVSSRLDNYSDDWLGVLRLWDGGIAMFGGLTGGALAAWWVTSRRGDFPTFADAVAVALPAAQAIGRWGNYFNQELFGTPTDLPWAIEIDPSQQPAWVRQDYPGATTFHPTFAYEMLWSVATIVFLLWLERRTALKKRGSLLLVYFVSYGTIRFLLEFLRTDTDWRLLGLSRNGWVSLLVVLAALAYLAYREGWLRRDGEPVGAEPAGDEAADRGEGGAATDEGLDGEKAAVAETGGDEQEETTSEEE